MTTRLLAAAVAVALVPLLTACEDEFKTDCTEQGGEVLEDTDTHVGTGIGAGGKPVTTITSTTTRFCVVDGDLVDVD